MSQQEIWSILGIPETTEEDIIKKAYRAKLTTVNPEDDMEGFMRLRNAYEQAINLINRPGDDIAEKQKDEVDLWIDRVDSVYLNMEYRRKEESWLELFRDDVCISIDTSMEAGMKLLEYLMQHYYLPNKIWKLIDSEFHIIEEKEQLYETLPRNFVDYVVNQITYEGFLDYALFEPVNGEDADEYIQIYFKLKEEIDNNRSEECLKLLESLKQYKTYHPYQDVERIRYQLMSGITAEMEQLSEVLFRKYPKDIYISCIWAKVKCALESYEEAQEQFGKILQDYPNYYLAKTGLLECLYKNKDYTAARDIAMDILELYPNDDVVLKLFNEINEILIQQYLNILREKEDLKVKLELAWCYYQNQRFDESIALLEEFPDEIRSEYDYINLHGRVYLSANRHEAAIDKLKVWVEAILQTKKDDSIVSKKRYNRLGYAYYSIGLCYTALERYEEAIPYYQTSIDEEQNLNNKLMSMERMAYTCLKAQKLQECIEISTKITEISSGYYPAYLHRQEASFELNNDQDVINDYHKAVDIYPGYIRPYLFAMKVYLRHNQLEDAKEVADHVKEGKLDSNEFRLLCIQITRRAAKTNEERSQAVQACLDLQKNLQSEDNDIEDPITLDYELALLFASLDRYDSALEIIQSIIMKRPGDNFYLYIKGLLLKDMKQYKNALAIFQSIKEDNSTNERIPYEIGCCYQMIDKPDSALKHFLKTVELNPKYSDVNERIVDIYRNMYTESQKRKYFKEALPYADMQIEIEENAYNYICRGLLYMDAYEFKEALSDFYKAMEYNPEDWAAYNNAGYTHLLMRNMDTALEELRKSTSLITIEKSFLPYANLARAYRILKKYDDALSCYEKLHAAHPGTATYINYISQIYKLKHDYKKSLEWQKKLKGIKGYKKEKIYEDMAKISFLAGSKRKAKDFYRSSMFVDPKNADVILNYAEYLYLNHKVSKAIYYIKEGIRYEYPNNNNYIEVCQRAAELYWDFQHDQKQKSSRKVESYKKKAVKYAELAIKTINSLFENEEEYFSYGGLRPKRLAILASIYLSLGEEQKAEYYIKLALNSSPCASCTHMRCVRAYELYGMLYEGKKQLEKATEYYKFIEDMDPGDIKFIKRLDNVSKRYGMRNGKENA